MIVLIYIQMYTCTIVHVYTYMYMYNCTCVYVQCTWCVYVTSVNFQHAHCTCSWDTNY